MKTSNKPWDFIQPSPYQVWLRFIKGSKLENKIGPWKFAKFLESHNAIELFYFKKEKQENLKCRIKNEAKISVLVNELENSSWLVQVSWFSQLVRRWKTRRNPTKDSKQSSH